MTHDLVIREYQDADFQHLVCAMEKLQQHIISVDNFHMNQMNPGYGEAYARKSLDKVAETNGKIYCAFLSDMFLGCIIGTIEEGTKHNSYDALQDFVVGKTGEVVELIIIPEKRGLGVGSKLMTIMEKFFQKSGCEFVYLDVFAPNEGAYEFYRNLGYENRMMTLIKRI